MVDCLPARRRLRETMVSRRYCDRMQEELDRTLLAKDAYRAWKRRVQNATASVRVFTPYLDRLLDRLLQNSDLDVGVLSVVTDLSPQSGKCQGG